ncbi:Gfo/Idh/MocA family oxidoreductase [Methanoculleus sp. FWC-SCC3]|uniref:Gfo/Idh/MocA family oxidoreductase n=1 Tax=Methanoculleus methanifontis TaxID=2584086 RepID=A0ABT8LZS2_9EURY|nr:Gfo/Idh/MocA family oxidoreductase [Methanoculleus sp. FWC-SCC3]MDN7011948.1 Gfo/Idh/MocA family oxidoreductase [Methanoculleus sp. FWC-SCC3]
MDAGVIGTGTMGRNHVRVYTELKEVGTTYVYDLNTKAAEEVAAATGAEVCRSMEELLAKAECVSVCVPTPYHLRTAGEVIAAGVHALIEKPLCITVRECEQLIGRIPEGLTVGVGHIERFNPVVTEVARVVQDPLYVSFNRHNPASARVSGSSVVEDLMIHDIDVAFNVLFPGREYTVHASGTGDVAAALASFGRTPVYLSASRKSSKKVRSLYIEEEDRTIEGDFMTQEVYVYKKPEIYGQENGLYRQENIIEKLLVNKVEPLKIELSTFIRAARDGKPFTVTPAQGLSNVRVCEAISRGLAA